MTNEAVARRYAKALFEIGLEENNLGEIRAELDKLAEYSGKGTLAFLENPVFSSQEKIRVMEGLLEKEKSSKEFQRFMDILIEAKRSDQIMAIARDFADLLDEHEGRERALVVSAVKLTQAQETRLSESLAKIRNKKVTIENVVDDSLVGGIRIRVGDVVYDSSILGFLEKFKSMA